MAEESTHFLKKGHLYQWSGASPNGAALSGVIRFLYPARIGPLADARGSVPSLLCESNLSHSREWTEPRASASGYRTPLNDTSFLFQ
ncbi:hypothetical protein Lwal_2331 [Legionella waltersii]|uniref:Uncharacterized protein n=1 Tax=Legionella waltersii TaxID=66969 RepID=A0A0W1A5H5_9GAMM|nr:hypothetical protein Lwal_2331 [Legionella waltersii]SNU94620.1 Uncharacterised protein [Legionella waltersii]